MRKLMKKMIRRSVPAILSAVLVLTSVPVAAAESTKSNSIMDSILEDAIQKGNEQAQLFKETGDQSLLYDTSYFNPAPAQTEGRRRASEEEMPEKFDLREEGYVTPVKMQNPFATCWGFASIAAAETSILSELGVKYDKETNDFDLSELHLAWFASHHLPEDSDTGQGGEGTYPGPLTSEGLNTGGMMYFGTIAFSSGMGPREEADVPYQPKDPDKHILKNLNDEDFYYSGYDDDEDVDWSVDESERFGVTYELEESSLLPVPVGHTEDGEYQYNELATEAFKKELMAGRAVSIGFHADQSRPGDDLTEGAYINPYTWAHYTYENVNITHAVTIVGWDDNYAVDNFLEGHQPPKPGAWIVKNSWGAESNDFPHKMAWGNDGYFYLSYYDQSITVAETFDFFVEGSGFDQLYANQYDYMTANSFYIDERAEKVSEANVFEAADMTLRCVAATTDQAGAKITYDIYKLNDNYTSPTDGTLLEAIEKTYDYAGYHRENLKTEQHFREGEHYSVVVTQESPDGKYVYGATRALSKSVWDLMTDGKQWDEISEEEQAMLAAYGSANRNYSVGVINEGESFLGAIGDSGEYVWEDWKDFSEEYIKETGNVFALDNFAIKAYSDPYEFPPQTTDLSTADVTLSKTSYTYNGNQQTPDVTVTVADQTLTKDKDYTVSYKNNINAGTATVTVQAMDNSGYTGSKAISFTIKKASQTLKLNVSKKTYKAKKLKKKKAKFTIKATKKKTSVTYEVTKGASKYIKVNKKGVVTMKKKAKKGTYKVTVTAKASANYESVKKVVTITVK